jgi:tetratricopeptide (TPR) repeat protein
MLVNEFVMSAIVLNSKPRLPPIVILFGVMLLLGVWTGQTKAQNRSVTPAEVAAILERVRGGQGTGANLQNALATGDLLLKEKRYADAAEIFQSVLESSSSETRALYGAALALFNLGNPTEAEPLAKTAADILTSAVSKPAVRVPPEQRGRAADALVLQAVVEAVRGKNADALKSSGLAVRIAPEHFDAQFTYGRALYSTGDMSGAAKAFRRAVALNPRDARALFFLGTTLEKTGDLEDALSSYRRIIAIQPQAPEGHLGAGTLLIRRGGAGGDEGINELERAVAIDGNLYEARVTLGRALLTRGRLTQAVEHLVRAAELAPENPEPHYQLSLAYRRLGLSDKAAQETAAVRRIHEARRIPNVNSNANSTPD